MRRSWMVLLLLLSTRAAFPWALPDCHAAAVCHMGPDGESCCPGGDCSTRECNRPDSSAGLIPAASLPPVFTVGLPAHEPVGLAPCEKPREKPTPCRDV